MLEVPHMSNTAEYQETRTRDLEAELNYLAAGIERPRTYTYSPPDDTPRSTVVSEPHRVDIRDARAAAVGATLDREGFALIRHRSAVRNFWDENEIRTRFYPEVEAAITAATGADRVVIFDHTLRKRVDGAEDRGGDLPRQPVPRVHVDHTVRSGPQRVRDLLPDEAETLLRGRVQIINLWRPIVGPLRDHPLAVADARTVAFEDLVPSDLIYPNRVQDEALLLKCYDSATDGRARFAPHTAFRDPTAAPDVRPRESIEIRTLVFHSS
jgi:hypothetical protein